MSPDRYTNEKQEAYIHHVYHRVARMKKRRPWRPNGDVRWMTRPCTGWCSAWEPEPKSRRKRGWKRCRRKCPPDARPASWLWCCWTDGWRGSEGEGWGEKENHATPRGLARNQDGRVQLARAVGAHSQRAGRVDGQSDCQLARSADGVRPTVELGSVAAGLGPSASHVGLERWFSQRHFGRCGVARRAAFAVVRN